MKKYVKPDLTYEQFELSRKIAACHFDLNLVDKETCATYVDPWGAVVISQEACQGAAIVEEYCYYPASGSEFKTFNS